VVVADDHALRRVLLNLLDNAVKYGPQGQTVSIELRAVDHGAQLTVDDAGPGIPVADRTRVFEPFMRLDHDAEGGSGIGLAIVRELVAAMHGTVVIEDAPSGGTRVRLTLPV
jgi:signal transduction histidine kinase